MIIVYQSLESLGEKANTGSTIFGNRFKHETQEHAHKTSPNNTADVMSRTWSENTTIETTRKIEFATQEDSKKFFEELKSEQDPTLKKKNLEYLLNKIVEYIKACCITRTLTSTNHNAGGLVPDIIVLGEIGGKDLYKIKIKGYRVVHSMDPSGNAQHRFTVLKSTSSSSDPFDFQLYFYNKTDPANKDISAVCVTMRVKGWLIACVHIPNNISNHAEFARRHIRYNVIQATKMRATEPDLIIGDTNQASNTTVVTYMNEGRPEDLPLWKSSINDNDGTQLSVDVSGYNTQKTKGTNSRSNKHYDIFVTPHPVSTPESNPEDVSEGTAFHNLGLTDKFLIEKEENGEKLYAYSDHHGVIVKVIRDKPEHLYKKEMVIRTRIKQKHLAAIKNNK